LSTWPPSIPWQFANNKDGYLFNPGLEVTSDGGRSRSEAELGDVGQLMTTARYAYALAS